MRAMAEPAIEIRPGVFRPDRRAATSAAARDALDGRSAARLGLLDKWRHALAPDEDRVWRCVLERYAALGRPPSAHEIGDGTGLPESSIPDVLRRLQRRDLLALSAAGSIRYAYPFTEAATGHLVTLRGRTLNALCAIDALGTGAMYGTDIVVRSACRSCGAAIRVATADAGRALAETAPGRALVWYDFSYGDSAAASCCPTIAFFCGDDHLHRWLDAQIPRRPGMRLAMSEALEVGRAIFGPVLRPGNDGEAAAGRGCEAPGDLLCALGEPEFRQRLAHIRKLTRQSLRERRREGLRLTLAYDASAADELRALVAMERECCRFLDFHLADRPDRIVLTITAPAGTTQSVEDIFSEFAGEASPPSSEGDDGPDGFHDAERPCSLQEPIGGAESAGDGKGKHE